MATSFERAHIRAQRIQADRTYILSSGVSGLHELVNLDFGWRSSFERLVIASQSPHLYESAI